MGIRSRVKKLVLPILSGKSSPPPPPEPAARAQPERRPAPPPPPEPKSPRGDRPAAEWIADTVASNKVVLFMKGSPQAPQCGFSANAAGILARRGRPFTHVDVLADPEVREAVKAFSSWPTIPQIYIGGEFVGGSDILREMDGNGELQQALDEAFAAD